MEFAWRSLSGKVLKWTYLLTLMASLPLVSGCGYTLQTSHSPLAEREGVRKIYIAPLQNNTYTPGAENIIYNALVQTISVHRRVTLVYSPEAADAVLRGTVNEADYLATAVGVPANLNPSNLGLNPSFVTENPLIAQYYSATMSCGFVLERVNPSPLQKKLVWSGGFTRSQPFPASNQLGPLGTTSALINESEFQRTLTAIATNMSADIHESMLAMF